MSDNWKIQVSPKLPDGTLVNLRAETPEEFEQILGWVEGHAERIGSVAGTLTAVGGVGQAFPGPGTQQVQQQAPPPQQGWSQQGSQQSQPAAAPQGGPPPKMCPHGAMTYREGNGQRGPWKGYFCPTAKGTPGQCKPEFIRD